MPKVCYVEKNFAPSSVEVIDQANEIIEDYLAQDLKLTLRQLYYRFVASDLIPNTQRSYKRLGSIINDARLAGLVDWEAIEDRGRNVNRISKWDDPGDIIESAARSYAIDLWEGQECRVEVWVEKQALEAVIKQASRKLACPSLACKGYMSQSELWSAAERFKRLRRDGQTPVIIHLGDHDPSGMDMTRDIADRLKVFGIPTEVNRIALNWDQIEEYQPPPNPAKTTDSRANAYIERYGDDSWELDALEPRVLRDLITTTIKRYMDLDLYQEHIDRQERERGLLNVASQNWSDLVEHIEENF